MNSKKRASWKEKESLVSCDDSRVRDAVSRVFSFFFFRYQDKSIARISVQSNVVGLIQTSPQSHTQPGARRIRTITMQHSRQHCTGKQRRSQDSEGTRGSHEGAEWTEIEQDRHGAGRKEATKDEVRKIEVFESVRKKKR